MGMRFKGIRNGIFASNVYIANLPVHRHFVDTCICVCG